MARISAPLPLVAACLNPNCHECVEWGVGRPQRYCSQACRKAAERALTRLTQKLSDVASELSGASGARATELRADQALLLWHLRRYAGLVLSDDGLKLVLETTG